MSMEKITHYQNLIDSFKNYLDETWESICDENCYNNIETLDDKQEFIDDIKSEYKFINDYKIVLESSILLGNVDSLDDSLINILTDTLKLLDIKVKASLSNVTSTEKKNFTNDINKKLVYSFHKVQKELFELNNDIVIPESSTILKHEEIIFEEIITMYELEKALEYYYRYNKSKYLNSYHGFTHMEMIVQSFYKSYSDNKDKFYMDDERIKRKMKGIILGLIFHDFNYETCDQSNKDYDNTNIEIACTGLKSFMNSKDNIKSISDCFERKICSISPVFEYHTLLEYKKIAIATIQATRYPTQNIDCYKYLTPFQIDMIRDADISMPLYDNYNELAWGIYTNELGLKTKEEYKNNCVTYFNNFKFNTNYWNSKCNTNQVVQHMTNFLDNISEDSYGREWDKIEFIK